MTLIVGMPCEGGLVFASDTQVSDQRTRTSNVKIRALNDCCLWAASGSVSVIQRLEERLQRLSNIDRPLAELREPIGLAIRDVMEELLRMDFRAGVVAGDLWKVERLHGSHFAFAEFREGHGRIYSVPTTGDGEWYTKPYALGGASDFAVALSKGYGGETLTPDRAIIAVVTTLETAIETAQSGIDYPLDVWRIDARGHHQLDERERAAVFCEVDRMRAVQRAMFSSWAIEDGSLEALGRKLAPETVVSMLVRPRR